MRITRRCEFDMAHRLPDHEGKCFRLHGHRYVVEVVITGDVQTEGSENGMVVDFAQVDMVLDSFVKRFDHMTMLVHTDPLLVAMQEAEIPLDSYGILAMEFVPTAENLAQYFLDTLKRQIHPDVKGVVGFHEVTVWETPKSSATAW